MQKIAAPRYTEKNVCAECYELGVKCQMSPKKCEPVKTTNLRPYNGIRFTADGFDCALPVTIDSHSVCAYECLYCFSDNMIGHSTQAREKPIGQASLKQLEAIFSGGGGKQGERFRHGLKYDRKNADGFPCPVQLGGLCDAGDSLEQNQGWLLKFVDVAIKYNQPVRMSTKGAVWLLKEYRDRIAKAPHLFWVAFSVITDDDVMLAQIDRFAPSATIRLESMRLLSEMGVSTSLRLRPMMLGITDKNDAYINLIRRAAAAGAKAISYEVGFYPGAIPLDSKWKWAELDKLSGYRLRNIYSQFGPMQACTRPSYLWTENIMHSVAEHAKENGLTIGVSDPAWKQLGESGCCCGIKQTDPVFGNWEAENATNALLHAKATGELIYFKDICPPWSLHTSAVGIVANAPGPKNLYWGRHTTWADVLRELWNTTGGQRSVMNYFQGALEPVDVLDEEGNRVYRYVGLTRKHLKSHWQVKDAENPFLVRQEQAQEA